MTISKSKSSRLSWILVETISLEIDKCKSKNAASVSSLNLTLGMNCRSDSVTVMRACCTGENQILFINWACPFPIWMSSRKNRYLFPVKPDTSTLYCWRFLHDRRDISRTSPIFWNIQMWRKLAAWIIVTAYSPDGHVCDRPERNICIHFKLSP